MRCAMVAHAARQNGASPCEFDACGRAISRDGGTPLAVVENGRDCSASIHLKDIVSPASRIASQRLRAMGIKTVMVTGDNPLTAAAIASEAGVDDFSPRQRRKTSSLYIRKEQAERQTHRHVRRRHQ